MRFSSRSPFARMLLAAPLLWLPLTFLHPMGEPYAGIADETDRWLFVHVGQLALAPFLAAGVWILLDGVQFGAAVVARAALALWMVFFSAFDAVAGIATGVLTRHANSLTGDDRAGVAAATDFLFDDSVLAGGGFSVLGNLGHGAWIVLAIAATVALHRARAGRTVVVATGVSVLFAAHSGLPAALGLIALFAAELLVLRRRVAAAPKAAAETRLDESPAETGVASV